MRSSSRAADDDSDGSTALNRCQPSARRIGSRSTIACSARWSFQRGTAHQDRPIASAIVARIEENQSVRRMAILSGKGKGAQARRIYRAAPVATIDPPEQRRQE